MQVCVFTFNIRLMSDLIRKSLVPISSNPRAHILSTNSLSHSTLALFLCLLSFSPISHRHCLCEPSNKDTHRQGLLHLVVDIFHRHTLTDMNYFRYGQCRGHTVLHDRVILWKTNVGDSSMAKITATMFTVFVI